MGSGLEWVLFGVAAVSWTGLGYWLIRLRRNREEAANAASLPVRSALSALFLSGMTSGAALLLSRRGASVDQMVSVLLLMDTSWENALLKYGLAVTYFLVALMMVVPALVRRRS